MGCGDLRCTSGNRARFQLVLRARAPGVSLLASLSKGTNSKIMVCNDIIDTSVLRGKYWLTRVLFLRCLGFVYTVAFLVALKDNSALVSRPAPHLSPSTAPSTRTHHTAVPGCVLCRQGHVIALSLSKMDSDFKRGALRTRMWCAVVVQACREVLPVDLMIAFSQRKKVSIFVPAFSNFRISFRFH